MRRAVVVPIAVLLAALVATGAFAATHVVSVTNFTFTPATSNIARGDIVRWNLDSGTHTVVDTSGMDLYGTMFTGTDTYTYSFKAAGVYAYKCGIHSSMTGKVRVPLTVTKTSATVANVRWATMDAAEGYVYDVQVRVPGDSWMFFKNGVTAPRANFSAPSGERDFRARLRRVGMGSSKWSLVVDATFG